MRLPIYKPAKITGDGRRAVALKKKHGAARRDTMRVIRNFGTFFQLNQQGLRVTPRWKILELWQTQNEAQGMKLSTVCSHRAIMDKYVVDPKNVEPALERVESYYSKQAFSRENASVGVTNKKTLYAIGIFELILTSPVAAVAYRQYQKDYTCFFFYNSLFGARPKHTAEAEIALTPTGAKVKWGPRKHMVDPPTAHLLYPYVWFMSPSDEIVNTFKHRWKDIIGRTKNMASSVDNWLKNVTKSDPKLVGVKMTSCCARVRLSCLLLKKYEDGDLSSQRFRCLLDHTVESAYAAYHRLEE